MVQSAATRAVRPSDDDAEGVRGRILDAAQDVFAARGYAGATTREIAERAGIGKRMLFYYFPTKDAVYRGVLERVVQGLVAIHATFRDEPGAIGLGDAVGGLTHFVAGNLPAFKVWMREIIDGGPHLAELTRTYIAPLYATAGEEVRRNMADGVFAPGDPLQVLVSVGGVSLFYFLILPMLPHIVDGDPLAPAALEARAAAARAFVMHGLAGAAGSGGE